MHSAINLAVEMMINIKVFFSWVLIFLLITTRLYLHVCPKFILSVMAMNVSSSLSCPCRIVSGHMDGCLHFVGVDSQRRQTLAHSKPVSVLRCGGGKVVSGGYDGMVMVHRLADLEREAAVTIHNGNNVTSLVLDNVSGWQDSGSF